MEEENLVGNKNFFSKWQYLLDKCSPHITLRWVAFTTSFCAYIVRVYFLNGWFIVTYGLGIYLLSQFIGFITPQVIKLSFYFSYVLNNCFIISPPHLCVKLFRFNLCFTTKLQWYFGYVYYYHFFERMMSRD